jgi:CheY-like chemotaxis protein
MPTPFPPSPHPQGSFPDPVRHEPFGGYDIPEKRKILVMDDEETVREVVRQMLQETGHEVACAKDGEEAIELYFKAKMSADPFSVVIMDLTIPGGMGGKEAIGKLREFDSGVKAVVSSGYSDDPVMANFREHGFNAVIAKPFRFTDLTRILQLLVSTP